MDDGQVRVEVQFKNALLWRAIFSTSKTVAEFCRETGFSQSVIGALLSLKKNPYHGGHGGLTKTARTLAAAVGIHPDELFPPALYSQHTGDPLAFEIGTEQLHSLSEGAVREMLMAGDESDPEQAFLSKETSRVLAQAMSRTLTKREMCVIRDRIYNNNSLKEIGEKLNVSRERVRMIEQKALRKMRHPSAMREINYEARGA